MLDLSVLISPHLSGDLYLDPGSGSFILQILLAALLGGAYALKVYWRRILSFFRKSNPEQELEEEDASDDE
jgi:hypothetical protein